MKKWIFVVSFLICGFLFFISGSLVGYSVCDKQVKDAALGKDKPARKPNIVTGVISPIIGRVVDKQTMKLEAKVRTPTLPAIQKASRYKAKLEGY